MMNNLDRQYIDYIYLLLYIIIILYIPYKFFHKYKTETIDITFESLKVWKSPVSELQAGFVRKLSRRAPA